MKIYLASRYSRRKELCKYRKALCHMGHEVTSSWLDTNYPTKSAGSSNCPQSEAHVWAGIDLFNIRNSDMVVSFTDGPNSGGKGGRHVEFGYAIALCKIVVIVGPRENVFHHLPQVTCFPTWQEFLNDMREQ